MVEAPESESLQIKFDKSMLYSDLLRFILIAILPSDADLLLSDLKKISHARWTATEAGDEATANALKQSENEVVTQLIRLGTAKPL